MDTQMRVTGSAKRTVGYVGQDGSHICVTGSPKRSGVVGHFSMHYPVVLKANRPVVQEVATTHSLWVLSV